MNMGEEVSHLKAHVNTFYNNGALQRASEQPHLKTNQKPSQINKKVGSQETGRNQPSNAKYVFGAATWIRGLIKPTEGTAVAYLDFSSQEHAIAGALSGDDKLWSAYQSGDPYLQFAKDAGLAPSKATKETHNAVRNQCKAIVLGVSYGMSYHSMANRAGIHLAEARELLQLHRETYHVFWSWAENNVDTALAGGTLTTPMGWQYRIGHADEANPRSALNWPMQAGGAEILRLTSVHLHQAGAWLCGPIHDAVLIEAPLDRIDSEVARTTEIMQQACRHVMRGKTCRVDADVIKSPDRFMDLDRGLKMWNSVMKSVGLPPYQHQEGGEI
ncbi:DNA polymerase [Ruegeria sp.]|uniref:DNA polymerase n=1 Tax=Ruegeria sp. TaxID=1879320 RepID=UPI003AFF8B84